MAKHRPQDEAPRGYRGSHRRGGGQFRHPHVRGESDPRKVRDMIEKAEQEEQDRR